MKITIVVNDYVWKRDFIAEHGFSLLIEKNGHKILFDTGQGYALMHNLNLLKVGLNSIDEIVLSHGHDDHTGGIKFFLEQGIYPPIIAHPDVNYPKFKIEGENKKNIGLKLPLDKFNVEYFKAPVEFFDGIVFSGEVPKVNKWELEETKYFREEDSNLIRDPFSDDTSLYVPLKEGLLVLTGCAHSGIINIVDYGMKITKSKKLFGIIGGMHLKSASENRIKKTIQILQDLNPEIITISHCTGFEAGVFFKNAFGKKIMFTGVSDSFTFD